VVFIESAAFTQRLRELACDNAEDVLDAIQDDLLANPQRGSVVQRLGGIRKARTGNPRRGKGKRGGFRYWYLFFWSAATISTCSFYWIRTSKKIWILNNGPSSSGWSRS